MQPGAGAALAAAMKSIEPRRYAGTRISGGQHERLTSLLARSNGVRGMDLAWSKPAGVGNLTSAMANIRKATDGYALTSPAFTPRIRNGTALAKAMQNVDRDFASNTHLIREPLPVPPAIRNYSADLLKLQREAEARRAEERAVEEERHEQSLAVQRAMYDALVESERARAADAEAAALREQTLVDRAQSAEDRAEASDKREAKMLRLTRVSVGITAFSLLVAIAAVLVAIVLAT